MVCKLEFRQPIRNHQEVVKITNEAIMSKKLTYFRKNCEEYPIEFSQ